MSNVDAAADTPVGVSSTRRVLGTVGLAAVCVTVAAAAVAATVITAVLVPHTVSFHPAAFVCLTLLLGYTHVCADRMVNEDGDIVAHYLDEALFVPMVLLLSPVELAVGVAVAALAGNVSRRRQALKTTFNVGQVVLAFLAGALVARVGGAGADRAVTTHALVAALAGGVVVVVLSPLAVSGIIRLSTGHSWRRGVVDAWHARRNNAFGALLLGAVSGVAVRAYPIAALPAIGVGFSVERAYISMFVQRRARMAAEALHGVIVPIWKSTEPEEVQDQVLAAARRILHVGHAELVPPTGPASRRWLRATVDDSLVLQVSQRLGGGTWHETEQSALNTLATVAAGALRNARLLAHMSAITDSQSEGVLTIDSFGLVTFANPAARRLVRCDDLVGRPADQVFALEGSEGPVDLAALAGSERGARDSDAVLIAGTERTPVAYTATCLTESQTGVVVVIHDITERKAFEEKLTYLAFHDPLTYLPNRRLFEDRLDHALARAERHPTTHALLMIDLDRFKLVNDSYGHPAGDCLLVNVAGQLRRSLRREDTCARIGGDEFAILLEDIAGVADAVDVAERILTALSRGSIVDGHEVFISASIGIATSDQAPTRDELVAAADAAAYAAKAGGKGQYQLFAPDATENPRARLELEGSLRRALENGEFEVYYQPQVDTATGEAVGAEALVRWNSAEGLVAPYRFIPLAEETGLIVPLGAWVLEESCRQAQEWTLAHPDLPPLEIAVNLSAHQLTRTTIVDEVAAVLARTGLRPEQLCLEITETVIMRDAEAAIATLRRLKHLGINLAIDDFGTGYSSLSYLKQFPVDVVKVDRTFLAGLGDNAVDTEIVAAVIRLAAACGISAVAEGVETEEHRALLEEMGCPLLQGYLISRPVQAPEFERFWTSHAAPLVPAPRRR